MELRWQMLAVVTLARTAMGFQYQSVAPIAPLLVPEFGLALADVGWLVGLYLLPGVVIALPGGMLSARYGDRRLAVAGLLLMTAGAAMMATAETGLALNAGRLLSGVGGILLNVIATKMIADWFAGRELVLAMSVLINAWPIGMAIALLTLGPVAETTSWRAAFGLAAGAAAFGALAIAWRYRSAPDAGPPGKPDLRSVGVDIRGLLALASMVWMLFNAAFACLLTYLPIWLVGRGESVSAAGSTASLLSLLTVITVQLGGVLAHRSGRGDTIAALATLVAAAAGAGMLLGSSPLPWVVALGLAIGLPASVFVSAPGQLLPPKARAAGMGIFYTVYYLGMALLPAAAGVASDAAGDAAAGIWSAVAMLAATVVLHGAYRVALRRTGAADAN